MSDQLSAWQLILNGDAALFAIVRLSLVVSLVCGNAGGASRHAARRAAGR